MVVTTYVSAATREQKEGVHSPSFEEQTEYKKVPALNSSSSACRMGCANLSVSCAWEGQDLGCPSIEQFLLLLTLRWAFILNQ